MFVSGKYVNTLAPDDLKERNRAWAARMISEDPDFFRRLERQQAPHYLWIGCSDSRVPANTIVGLDPGELFVHRNVANLASPQDANYLSVLQFAVDVLKVQHIMVVGHYDCGGVSAAVDGRRRGLVDHWLHPIRELSRTHSQELEALQDERRRLDRLCELNVMQQVKNVASDVFVLDAWARGQHLSVLSPLDDDNERDRLRFAVERPRGHRVHADAEAAPGDALGPCDRERSRTGGEQG